MKSEATPSWTRKRRKNPQSDF
uniref:Uncharacterized protein n=1 Tax=Lepeophtheirus salmonis TaxID=72036 RepID=A0A0K2VKU1_LEPSM